MPQDPATGDDNQSHRESGAGDGARARHGRRRGRPTRPAVSVHRHQARILALQVIYEVDVTDHGLDDVIERTLRDPEETVPSDVQSYAERIARGADAHRDQIDGFIAEAAPAFPVPQLASVDRNVLRLAIYELLHEPDVPLKAAINEAVELAKRYGGLNSSKFVNGVLGTVLTKIEQERTKAEDDSAPPSPSS